ncbi:MAG: YqaA family protein, partial [Bacteroidota bacterium]
MQNISAWLRKLKAWVESFAEKPGAEWSLFGVAFIESSFFPIPPDVLLIALAVSAPKKSFRYALVCSVGSVLGGMLGYLIGLEFYDLIGSPIISFYALEQEYLKVQQLYIENAFLA